MRTLFSVSNFFNDYRSIIENKILKLQGFVASIDGKEMIKDKIEGSIADAEKLGEKLAKQLLDQGADKILASLVI